MNGDFNPVEFVREYDARKLSLFSGLVNNVELEGRQVLYTFEPDQYSLNLFTESNSYQKIGSTNFDKITNSVPLSLSQFNIPADAKILIVANEYNTDYYIAS
ncbi:MAG: hypothetical protein ABI721_05530 [Candidatus Dojkabacteria bacterium]